MLQAKHDFQPNPAVYLPFVTFTSFYFFFCVLCPFRTWLITSLHKILPIADLSNAFLFAIPITPPLFCSVYSHKVGDQLPYRCPVYLRQALCVSNSPTHPSSLIMQKISNFSFKFWVCFLFASIFFKDFFFIFYNLYKYRPPQKFAVPDGLHFSSFI